jgi:hypothetical protein
MSLLTTGYEWLRDQLTTQVGEEVTATFEPAVGDSFTASVISRAVIGGDEFPDSGEEIRVLRTSISVLRSVFTAEGITEAPATMFVTVHGAKWSIDMAGTDWGKVVVKLGLEREPKINEWQARRAAV